MEHEVERLCALGQSELGRGDLLALLEDVGAQLDVARLVHAVHVAERRGQQVLAVLACAERLDGLLEVLGGGVELLVDLGLDAVLLAADDADLDLEDDLGGGRFLEQFAWRSSRFSSIGTAEPSHMCDWNSGFLPSATRFCEIASSGRT